MKINRIAQVGALAAVAALALAGCAANEGGTTSSSSDAPAGNLSGDLVGGGATSQEVAIQTWTAGIQKTNADLTVTYDAGGSGAGRDSFQEGAFQFAGSDRAFKTDEIEAGPWAGCVDGSDIVEIPTYISPIAVVFNLDGVDSLNLDAATLAGIFAGTITTWNDPAITALNDGVDLPSTAINTVHRSDKSGTTGNFTDYLAKTAESVWTYGSVEEWPVSGGEAANGTSGVISAVQGGQGTIGYADASRAGELGTVAIQVGEDFVSYSPEAAAAVVDASPEEEGRAATDIAIAIDRTSTEKDVYPLVLVSYLIGCAEYEDADVAANVKGFFSYAASEEGQAEAAAASGSAPITDTLRDQITTAIEAIK
ncbi:phosphate ABC transporter substrate-binding protein PstS [Microbacterium sp. cx-55]|uniref:phosphate ABC transporter substrate-binding protein PstS n=1 Tax=unclassified Microbacterium TaxID=2609290 RepID=UPI001CC149B1|nr:MULTISPECIES: phosphate ABC transporter substrate-binding protein PstS [unclassified Microbacterium]MBZ4488125.1 phosphate ABC transporter substrate-binding protein PstS [Microbacterium sp. cx-55]MCC4908871.1 phosphate ABC transporter substrate-binding protein PstS [Microbacterium sp. cx-59]UGB34465.1 phosphate ABC transporter substrate-binding protein PstS [Microbacterium sp. cx-55]